MRDLVWKDFVQNRKALATYFTLGAVILLISLAGTVNGESMVGMFVLLAGYSFAINATYSEEKNHTFLFLKGLPLSDEAIVGSKFLSVGGAILASAVFFGSIAIVAGAISGRGAVDRESLKQTAWLIATMMGLSLVFNGVYLAMFFVAGFSKASTYIRWVFMAILVVTMGGAAAMSRLFPSAGEWLERATASGPPPWFVYLPLAIFAAGIAVYLICYEISIARVRSRDWA